jgi:hypothetical protein
MLHTIAGKDACKAGLLGPAGVGLLAFRERCAGCVERDVRSPWRADVSNPCSCPQGCVVYPCVSLCSLVTPGRLLFRNILGVYCFV